MGWNGMVMEDGMEGQNEREKVGGSERGRGQNT